MQPLRVVIVVSIIFTLVSTSCIMGIAQREDQGLTYVNPLDDAASHEIAEKDGGTHVFIQKSSDSNQGVVVLNGDELDQQQPYLSGFQWGVYGPHAKLAQSFKPTLPVLSRVELRIRRKGSPDGLHISIHSELTEPALSSVYLQAFDFPPNVSQWVEVDLLDIALQPENTYYLVWSPSGATNENTTFYWGLADRDPYTRGSPWKYLEDTWEEITEIEFQQYEIQDPDFCFKTYGYTNQPPVTPTTPTGPITGVIGEILEYESTFADPEGDMMSVLFDWGDGTDSGWIGGITNGTVGKTHSWTANGTYQIKTKARDAFGDSPWSQSLTLTIGNLPPKKPSIPTGPQTGRISRSYTYTTSTTDPNLDQIYYWFDWDDGTNTNWVGPYDSGQQASASHVWTEQGSYQIKVKCKDVYGAESVWSEPLPIRMPKSTLVTTMFFRFFQASPLYSLLFDILSRTYDQ
jgi:hypothetical protein